MNRLYNAIQGDAVLAKDIKVIGIAVANNQKQVDAYRTQFRVAFPMFPDETGVSYNALKQPSVPTLVVATTEGKVLMSHRGELKDFDGLLKELREIHKKQ